MSGTESALSPKGWRGRFCTGCGSRSEDRCCPEKNMVTAMQYIEYLERWQEDASDVMIAALKCRDTIPARRLEGSSPYIDLARAVDRYKSRRLVA